MDTYFDIAERNPQALLNEKIEIINNSHLMKILLNSIKGLLAVIDEHRQIISLNENYLKVLGIKDPSRVLGLRQGEALNCVHSKGFPNGCGTTLFCQSCGAAIAIAASLAENRTEERKCAITTSRNGKERDLFLSVICEPIVIEDTRFLLLFLRDITKDHQRAILERSFFHDLNNMIAGLSIANQQLSQGRFNDTIVSIIDTSTRSLIKEIEVQQCLMFNKMEYYQSAELSISPNKLFFDLDRLYQEHPVKKNKDLIFEYNESEKLLDTDEPLLLRILANMITNALEAEQDKGLVRLWWEDCEDTIKFSVHNDTFIPNEIQLKIFQRNFSTKGQPGRGIGTYSMKLFGEKILHGIVDFISSEESGTQFSITLPVKISN